MLRLLCRYKATTAYIVIIVALNTLYSYLPNVAYFGQSFSPADMVVGIIYVTRDFAQREIRHYILVAMLIGALLSYIFAAPVVADASIAAFVVAELIDWAIFTWTRKPLSERLLWSSLISTPADTTVFLLVAGRFHHIPFIMMNAGKFAGVWLLWGVWKLTRRKHYE